MATKPTRTRNPRRVVLEVLRNMKRNVNTIQGNWDVRSTVYITLADRKPGENAWLRPRQPEEYPENNADDWARLETFMDSVISDAEAVRRLARAKYAELLNQREPVGPEPWEDPQRREDNLAAAEDATW